MVMQLIRDYEDVQAVNAQLEKMCVPLLPLAAWSCMQQFDALPLIPAADYKQKAYTHPCRGYNIGQKLIDEFLAKSGLGACSSFREVAEVIAKVR